MNILKVAKTFVAFAVLSTLSVASQAQTLVKVEPVEQVSLSQIAEFYLANSMKASADELTIDKEVTIEVAINQPVATDNEETVSLVNYAD